MTTAPPPAMHPTRTSSGSYNSHPYGRQISPDRTLPRIRLPPPYPATTANRHSTSPVDNCSPYPSLTPRHADPSSSAPRDSKSPLQNTHMRLPPVHSFSRPHPNNHVPQPPPSPPPPRRSSEQAYGHPPWAPYSPHQSHHPIPSIQSAHGARHPSPIHRRGRYESEKELSNDHAYVSPPSPPLRPLPPTHRYSYGSEYVPRSRGAPFARSHDRSLADGPSHHRPVLRRAQTEREQQEERDEAERVAVSQDTRRRNHLMSEQKRRESINSGFTALRKNLPSCLSSDSKAIILRKAAAYIAQLEDRLRREGITVTPGNLAGANASPNSWDDNEMDEIQTNDDVDVKPLLETSPPPSELESRHTDDKE